MDFYAKFSKQLDSEKLVIVGKITSCVVIVIAALWAPQIGKFGSLLKYYQEMLSYIAPPVVAVFIAGIFSKRVNRQGAFIGLMGGLLIAILLLLFKTALFGNLHFLFIVPFLFCFCLILTYISSLFFVPPTSEKLTNTTFSTHDFMVEYNALKNSVWYKNYLLWAVILIMLCALLWILFK
jgi:SSS family solute:Na+ symporter